MLKSLVWRIGVSVLICLPHGCGTNNQDMAAGGQQPTASQPMPLVFGSGRYFQLTSAAANGFLIQDFNRDGFNEILIFHGAGQVSIVGWHKDSRRFDLSTQIKTGRNGGPVALTDFNDDGIADLVTGSGGKWLPAKIIGNVCGSELSVNHRIPVFIGKADGSFELKAPCPKTEDGNSWDDRRISDITIADFNGDGHQDFAAARVGNYGANYVAIFLGRGDGSFEAAKKIDWQRPIRLHATDFDQDGDADLLVSGRLRSDIYWGMGDGSFAEPKSYTFGAKAVVEDVNGDLMPDVLTADAESGRIMLLVGTQGREFERRGPTAVSAKDLTKLKAVDIDGDGDKDLVVLRRKSNVLEAFLNMAGDRFTLQASPISVRGRPMDFAVADMNNDALPDLVFIFRPDDRTAAGGVLFQSNPRALADEMVPTEADTARELGGKFVSIEGFIRAVDSEYVFLSRMKIRVTPKTRIQYEKSKRRELTAGQFVEVRAKKYIDGSMDAMKIKVKHRD